MWKARGRKKYTKFREAREEPSRVERTFSNKSQRSIRMSTTCCKTCKLASSQGRSKRRNNIKIILIEVAVE